jgi:hypothetical protein
MIHPLVPIAPVPAERERETRIKEIQAFTHHQILALKLDELQELMVEIKKLDDQRLAIVLKAIEGVCERRPIMQRYYANTTNSRDWLSRLISRLFSCFCPEWLLKQSQSLR